MMIARFLCMQVETNHCGLLNNSTPTIVVLNFSLIYYVSALRLVLFLLVKLALTCMVVLRA